MTRLRRVHLKDAVILLLSGLVFAILIGLGNWQMDRLAWKTGLIEAVETRAYGEPVPPPLWQDASTQAYLRVIVEGEFRHKLSKKVKAVTGLGPGHWLMVPLETARGHVWINRGFVPSGSTEEDWERKDGLQPVTGLLRLSEPEGTFLERNDPKTSRWVSRDVDHLSEDTGLANAAPYFIDAEHTGDPEAWPRGGLTKLTFNNPHLAYALTWYAMALLLLIGVVYAVFFSSWSQPDTTASSGTEK